MTDTAHELCGFTLAEWNRLPLEYRIRFAAGLYIGWGYHKSNVSFAYWSPSVPEKLILKPFATGMTNCSTLTTSVITACFPSSHWDSRSYGDMQVFKDRLPGNFSSPIDAVERVGIGKRLDQGFAPNLWHLVQGWRTLGPPRGHAFLVRADVDSLLVLEAVGGIGPRWTRTTEAKLRKRYPAALYAASIGPGIRS